MKYATKTNNKTALLAILAVFAMIAAGAAVVMASDEAQATWDTSTQTGIEADPLEDADDISAAADMAKKYYYTGDTTATGITIGAGTVSIYMNGTAASALKINGAANANVTIFVTSVAKAADATQVTYYKDYSFTVCVTAGQSITVTNVTADDVPSVKIDDLAKVASLNKAVLVTAGPVNTVVMEKVIALDAENEAVSILPGTTGKYTISGAKAAAPATVISTLEVTATSGSATVTCDADGNLSTATVTFTGSLKASPASGTFISEFDAATATIKDKTITTAPSAGSVKLVSGTFTSGAQAGVVGNLTVGPDAGLTLSGNYTMAAAAEKETYLIVEGTIASTTEDNRTIAGTAGAGVEYFGFAPSATISAKILLGENMVVYEYAPGSYEIKGTLQDNTNLTDATLSGNLIIPEGMTLTISGVLAMKNFSITVQGTLKIQSTGVIGSQFADAGAIILESTGAIVNNGAIGKNFATTIKASDTSKIEVLGVNGFEVSATTTGVLNVAGVITTLNATLPTVTDHAITATGAAIYGLMSLTTGTTLISDSSYVAADSGLIVNTGAILGSAVDDKLIVKNGGAVEVNGKFIGVIAVEVNDQIAVNALTPVYTETTFSAAVGAATVTGFTISADRVQYTYDKNLYYSQRAYISGAVNVSDGTTDCVLTLDGGYAFVDEGDTLTIGSHATFTATTNLVVLGEVIGQAPAATVIGAAYQVKVGNVNVNHISNFDIAMENIATAVSKTVTLYGLADAATAIKNGDATYHIAGTLELESGWTIAIFGANPSLYIDSGAEVIVNSGATLDAKNIMAGGIGGKLFVMNGGSCNPSLAQYQVSLTDSDNNKEYAALEIILDDAEVGDEVILVGDSLANTSITVPSGVKLTLKATLSTKALTVSELALVKVENSGTLTLINSATASATMTINGAVDAVNGSFTAPKVTNAAKIKAVGELVITAAQESLLTGADAIITGAKYTDTYGNIVYTSVENAVESGAKTITIDQDYSSSEDIVLPMNGNITVAAGKKATIGSIDISAGATVTATGTLNATIAGVSGVDGEDDVAIIVSAFKGSFAQTSAMDGKGVTKYTFATGGNITDGTVYVTEGTLTVAHTIQAATVDTYAFSLGSEAAMVLNVDPAFTGFFEVILAGKVTTATGVSMTIADPAIISGDVVLGGHIIATDDIILSGSLQAKGDGSSIANGVLCVLGTIVLPEDGDFDIGNGATVVWGSSAVGAGPSISGKLNFAHESAYIISYELLGEDSFVNPNTVNGVVFFVNGEDYLYAYCPAVGGTATVRAVIINEYTIWSLPGYDISDIKQSASWKDANGAAMTDASLLRDQDMLFYGAAVQQVHVKASWDTGMSLYVDNIRVTAVDIDLDVGNHTVMVKANPGYKFADGTTPTITFAGKAVTGLLTINVTSDMVNPVLSATGDIVVDQPDIPEQEKKDDSMIMILLGVLVVMVVILAIVTVIRMMRS